LAWASFSALSGIGRNQIRHSKPELGADVQKDGGVMRES
jgi:hypothetical protein